MAKKKEGFGGGSFGGSGASPSDEKEVKQTTLDPNKYPVPVTGGNAPALPSANPPTSMNKQITFLPSGRVQVDVAGQTFNFSKEEYNSTLPSKAGSDFIYKAPAKGFQAAQSAENQKVTALQPILEQIGQAPMSPETFEQQTQSDTNIAGAGVAALGGAIGAGATGAAAGSVAGPIGAAIGGVGGLVVGGVGGFITKITISKKQSVKESLKNYNLAKRNMNSIIEAVNAGLISPQDAVLQFNEQKKHVIIAEAKLKKEVSNDLDRFLTGGGDELAEISDFKQSGIPLLEATLGSSILNPNPNAARKIQFEVSNE